MINSQIKRNVNVIKIYLKTFVNIELNNLAKFLLITKFIYNNIKNISIKHFGVKF